MQSSKHTQMPRGHYFNATPPSTASTRAGPRARRSSSTTRSCTRSSHRPPPARDVRCGLVPDAHHDAARAARLSHLDWLGGRRSSRAVRSGLRRREWLSPRLLHLVPRSPRAKLLLLLGRVAQFLEVCVSFSVLFVLNNLVVLDAEFVCTDVSIPHQIEICALIPNSRFRSFCRTRFQTR